MQEPASMIEEFASFSTDVSWSASFIVSKADEKYSVYIDCSAIADVSYDRWVDTYGYSLARKLSH